MVPLILGKKIRMLNINTVLFSPILPINHRSVNSVHLWLIYGLFPRTCVVCWRCRYWLLQQLITWPIDVSDSAYLIRVYIADHDHRTHSWQLTWWEHSWQVRTPPAADHVTRSWQLISSVASWEDRREKYDSATLVVEFPVYRKPK